MKAKKRKEIVIDLIVNDLVSTRLISGLNALNVEAGVYSMYLEKPILRLMGFKKSMLEEDCLFGLYDLYSKLIDRPDLNICDDDRRSLVPVAKEIYKELKKGVEGFLEKVRLDVGEGTPVEGSEDTPGGTMEDRILNEGVE